MIDAGAISDLSCEEEAVIKSWLKAAANLSPAKAWKYLSEPSMIPVRLTAPGRSTIEKIVLAVFPKRTARDVDDCRTEFLRDHAFFEQLNDRLIAVRGRRSNCQGWPELVYVLTRFGRPAVMVETGVFDGQSSAVILRALQRNGTGMLISIDLPARETIAGSTQCMKETRLPPGRQPGWVIPDSLRQQHRLLFGDSKVLLPQVLEEHAQIDVFFHDSLHTYEHQWFEYSAAWPHLVPGGLLLSDDILWNAAFHRFCRQHGRPYHVFDGFGLAVKGA